MGAGQGLQPAVPLAYGLPAQATVQLGLLHALVEAHDVGSQLPLQPLAAAYALTQTVQLQLAQLGQQGPESGRKGRDWVSVAEQPPASLLAQPVKLSPLGHQAVSSHGVQCWLNSCLAGGLRKNILPSLGLGFPSCRMRGWVRSVFLTPITCCIDSIINSLSCFR